MTRFAKLYAKITNNPRDVNFDDIDKLLRKFGFKCRQPGTGSSHYTYYHPNLPEVLTIPQNRAIKAIYVKKALEAIEKIKGGSEL